MAGLFNSGIRDYCGDESSISQLSNHFSKDYSLQFEGINQTVLPNVHQSIPTSFNLNHLLNNVISNDKKVTSNIESSESSCCDGRIIDNTGSTDLSINMMHQPQFMTPAYFCPPPISDHTAVARVWAHSELAQFDQCVITEEDFKELSEADLSRGPDIRFSDVIRNMALEEELNEINISSGDEFKGANNDFLYDLDRDLKNMRERLLFNEEFNDLWPQVSQHVQPKTIVFDFVKDNHYADGLKNDQGNQKEKTEELLNKGIQLYREGYFSEAMLIFEAVVQSNPESESAWQYLALSLSENEQDHRATVACKRCLDINKDNRDILLSLARIYCNEMNIASTIACLERWLLSNPKYRDLATVGQEAIHSAGNREDSIWQDMFEESFESSGQFGIIQQQLSAAQTRNGSEIDPELEIVLGTLYHVIQDYDKSTAHFENAANVSKSSALLWNKLGTAYCNSGNFDKAISMYQQALELAPGFVRAECNLGVSFYNMGSYSDAIKHALKAYKLQHPVAANGVQHSLRTTEVTDTVVETDPIWTLIRMSCFKMDRPDLDLVVFSRDVDTLCTEFAV